MRLRTAALALGAVMLVDQFAKALAFSSTSSSVVPARNPGLLMGVGAGPRPALLIVSAAAVMLFVAVVGRWTVQIGVAPFLPAIVAGGMLSNALDRLRFGSVRDFLQTPPLIINLADLAVAGGIVALGIAVAVRLSYLRRTAQTVVFEPRGLRAVVVARD
jgi:lipoprotein signal peptidase